MKVQVVTPWFPSEALPFEGIFVKAQVDALRASGLDVAVEVPEIFPAPRGPLDPEVEAAMRSLASEEPEAVYPTRDGATWIPTPVAAGSGYRGRINSFATHVEAKRDVLPIDADVVHAHLGVPTAAAQSRIDPDTPLVVTEHQSSLQRVFDDPDARSAYADTIKAATTFLCVSSHLRDRIADELGRWTLDRIRVVPNIVDLSHIELVDRPSHTFRHWVYVGSLSANKGVELLLTSFALYRSTVDNEAELTLVGDGPHRRWIEHFVGDRNLTRAVRLVGSVPHHDVGRHLADADVLVHLSPSETFGIASLEAIGAGLPVVSLRNGGAEDAWGHLEASLGVLLPSKATPETIVAGFDELRRRAGELDPAAGRRMIEQHFSAEAVVSDLVEIYTEAVER